MENFFENLTSGSFSNLAWLWNLILILLGVYIIIYSLLQIRELRVLQGKVKTSSDTSLRVFSYLYFLLQIVLVFVVVAVIL